MKQEQIPAILERMGVNQPVSNLRRFQSEEDGESYNVWYMEIHGTPVVLKEAKGCETDTYQTFFTGECLYAPRLLATALKGEKEYLLMPYIPGRSLRRCGREGLIRVLDSLIAMQNSWWGCPAPEKGFHYMESLTGRKKRRNYLGDTTLEAAYDAFLQEYQRVPRTLCHDDLLPFNVIDTGDKAVFIDWEYGGILPYPTSLARFLAHCEEAEDAFFYMTEADKAFALDYYYQHLIWEKGIAYGEYRNTFRLFLFYEYCEWVYLGIRFNNTSTPRFRRYHAKAKQLAQEMGF